MLARLQEHDSRCGEHENHETHENQENVDPQGHQGQENQQNAPNLAILPMSDQDQDGKLGKVTTGTAGTTNETEQALKKRRKEVAKSLHSKDINQYLDEEHVLPSMSDPKHRAFQGKEIAAALKPMFPQRSQVDDSITITCRVRIN